MTLSEQAKGLIEKLRKNAQAIVANIGHLGVTLDDTVEWKAADLLTQALKELEASDKVVLQIPSHLAPEHDGTSLTCDICKAIESARTRLSSTAKGGV